MTTFDRDTTIYRTAREVFDEEEPSEGNFDAILLALPLIAADVLAPLKTLHPMLTDQVMWRDSAGDDHIEKRRFCGHCKRVWPCPTAQAIADIEAKAGVK